MTHKLGIDIGGTFTDFALLDETTGHIAIHKQLTTPHEPSECVLDGARNILSAKPNTDAAPRREGRVRQTRTLSS